MGRYLDLARRALESSPEALSYEINEITKKGVIDPYQEHARASLARICRPDYPAGLIPWLGEKHPPLYEELTARLPDEIHRLWVERASLEQFDRILGLWLEAHRTACELYCRSHIDSREGEK
jgi:hypothetical protein